MDDASLEDLEQQRGRLFDELAATGDSSNRFEHIWTRPTPGTAGRGSTAVPGIMRLCLTTDEWLSGMGLRSLAAG